MRKQEIKNILIECLVEKLFFDESALDLIVESEIKSDLKMKEMELKFKERELELKLEMELKMKERELELSLQRE